MAQVGLKSFKYNPIDVETKKYKALAGSKVPVIEGAIESKATLNLNSAKMYSDDALSEEDTSFNNGTLDLTISDDEDTVFAELLGHEKTSDGEIIRKATDVAPYVGFGRVITKIIRGVKKYKVEFFPKVKFAPFIADAKTKGESVEFGTASVSGTIYALNEKINGMDIGTYEKHKTFDTEDAANTYLDSLLTPSVVRTADK